MTDYIVRVTSGVVDAVRVWRQAGMPGAPWIQTTEHVSVGWSYDGTSFTPPPGAPPPTAQEQEDKVQADLDDQEASDVEKSLLMLIADLYRAQNGGTIQEARQAVRDRRAVHLRTLRGL